MPDEKNRPRRFVEDHATRAQRHRAPQEKIGVKQAMPPFHAFVSHFTGPRAFPA
jgi:hypothetical protein